MNDLDLDQKRNRIETVVKILAVLAVGFFVAPVILITIKGLIGLVTAGAIALVAINLTPWFSAVVANWRLKALKHEAAKNPIETLQNDYRRRVEALQAFRQSILNSKAEVAMFGDKLEGFKRQYPADAAKFDTQYAQMAALLQLRGRKYAEAKDNLARYNSEIDRAKAIWEMAQAAAQMNKVAGVDTDEFYAKIQVETALGSVEKSLNVAFADLELSLADEKADKASKATPVAPAQSAIGGPDTPKALGAGATTLDLNTLDLDVSVPHPVSHKA